MQAQTLHFNTKPFLKWWGGKRQLLKELKSRLPSDINVMTFHEVFVGGGAFMLDVNPSKLYINDYNSELINTYKMVKDNLMALIDDLSTHQNNIQYFNNIRSLDRLDHYGEMDPVKRASRFIYLNKTCFNGLYRVNGKNQFNTPFGNYKNPKILDVDTLTNVSTYLNSIDVKITNGDYRLCIDDITSNSFVYLDPPYHPISATSSFTSYVSGGWDEKDHYAVKEFCDIINNKGAKFMLSNSNTDTVLELYKDYNIEIINVHRNCASRSSNRGIVQEVIVRNY